MMLFGWKKVYVLEEEREGETLQYLFSSKKLRDIFLETLVACKTETHYSSWLEYQHKPRNEESWEEYSELLGVYEGYYYSYLWMHKKHPFFSWVYDDPTFEKEINIIQK